MGQVNRIATVHATGERFLVAFIDCSGPVNQVHCYGHIVSFRGLKSKSDGVKVFSGSDVKVAPVRVTTDLLRELVEQYLESLRREGKFVAESRSGRTYEVYESFEAAAASRVERRAAELMRSEKQ